MSGMTLWKVTIHKNDTKRFWTNVYHVNAPSLSAAITAGSAIAARERAIHKEWITFSHLEVAPAYLTSGGGTVLPINQLGQVTATGDVFPFFAVARVSFRPATGKPSQKYLRLPLMEGDVTNDSLTTALTTLITNSYAAPMLADPAYVDVDGQAFTSYIVHKLVQMRQQKRQRRARAGFKRGWVPA